MFSLHLPSGTFQVVKKEEGNYIFDSVRKKYVFLTPEEWVRQHIIYYLGKEFFVPYSLVAIEKELVFNTMKRRADIVIYDKIHKPLLIVECKSPKISITQEAFEQIARYNMTLKVPYLMVTNGIIHYYCYVNHETSEVFFLNHLPTYEEMGLRQHQLK